MCQVSGVRCQVPRAGDQVARLAKNRQGGIRARMAERAWNERKENEDENEDEDENR